MLWSFGLRPISFYIGPIAQSGGATKHFSFATGVGGRHLGADQELFPQLPS